MRINLEIDITHHNQVSIVTLSGEIDIHTAPELREAILPLTKKEGAMIEVDLENISYMDSTGLGVFISVLKSTKEYNSEFKLMNLQDRVMRLFTITGLNEIMNISATIRGGEK